MVGSWQRTTLMPSKILTRERLEQFKDMLKARDTHGGSIPYWVTEDCIDFMEHHLLPVIKMVASADHSCSGPKCTCAVHKAERIRDEGGY
jgi:hypothetical protein